MKHGTEVSQSIKLLPKSKILTWIPMQKALTHVLKFEHVSSPIEVDWTTYDYV